MTKDRFLVFLIVVLSLAPLNQAHAITVIDDRGKNISLAHPASRIISLAPHITELLYAIGAGEKLIATVAFSDYPQAATKLPRIGDAMRVDMEQVIFLEPDLVVAWLTGNSPGDLDRLEKLGINVYVMEIGSLDQIAIQMINLGKLAGTESSANKQADQYKQKLDALRAAYQSGELVSVFYQIWNKPLMTINDRHIISDGIRLCAGENLFADVEPIAAAVSLEAVLAANPDVIIANASEQDSDAVLNAWRKWKSLAVVQKEHLFTIPHEFITRPTPRILQGVQIICEALEKARN